MLLITTCFQTRINAIKFLKSQDVLVSLSLRHSGDVH